MQHTKNQYEQQAIFTRSHMKCTDSTNSKASAWSHAHDSMSMYTLNPMLVMPEQPRQIICAIKKRLLTYEEECSWGYLSFAAIRDAWCVAKGIAVEWVQCISSNIDNEMKRLRKWEVRKCTVLLILTRACFEWNSHLVEARMISDRADHGSGITKLTAIHEMVS